VVYLSNARKGGSIFTRQVSCEFPVTDNEQSSVPVLELNIYSKGTKILITCSNSTLSVRAELWSRGC